MSEQLALKCKSCGAHLEGAGKKRQITCPYCGIVNVFERQAASEHEIICPACGTANKKEFEHCVDCGQNLYQNCPKCGTRNEADASFCAKCGLDLEKAFRIQRKYFEYLAEAKRVSNEYIRTYRTYMGVGITGVLICTILVLTTDFTSAGVTPTSISILLGMLVSYSIGFYGAMKAQKKVNTEVQKNKFNLIGFDEFYKLYARKNKITHYWPNQMVTGNKLEKFLSMAKLHED
ncbi:MAG: zinc ribbon domain-containing protein [Anaerolineaceae bacterium]